MRTIIMTDRHREAAQCDRWNREANQVSFAMKKETGHGIEFVVFSLRFNSACVYSTDGYAKASPTGMYVTRRSLRLLTCRVCTMLDTGYTCQTIGRSSVCESARDEEWSNEY